MKKKLISLSSILFAFTVLPAGAQHSLNEQFLENPFFIPGGSTAIAGSIPSEWEPNKCYAIFRLKKNQKKLKHRGWQENGEEAIWIAQSLTIRRDKYHCVYDRCNKTWIQVNTVPEPPLKPPKQSNPYVHFAAKFESVYARDTFRISAPHGWLELSGFRPTDKLLCFWYSEGRAKLEAGKSGVIVNSVNGEPFHYITDSVINPDPADLIEAFTYRRGKDSLVIVVRMQ